MGSAPTTLFEKLKEARAKLVAADASPEEAAIDVDLYARSILGWDKATLLERQREEAPAILEPTFSEWVERRQRREPTAYIVRSREFWGRDFLVTPAVLVPRPETELIVEEALALARGNEAARIADIGTGSGILAVTLAVELRGAHLIATDVSGDALDVARENARRYGVDGRIRFVETSYLDGINERFDVIVSNPPYVKDGDRRGLSLDVRHEPDVALFGGPDGLRGVSGALDAASTHLDPGAWFVMEFGFGQEDDVRRLVSERAGLRLDHLREDLQGLARTAVMQKE